MGSIVPLKLDTTTTIAWFCECSLNIFESYLYIFNVFFSLIPCG